MRGGYPVSLDIEKQYDKIYRYCYFKTGSAVLAEDLTQETFLKYFSQSSYINRGKPLAYLYTIAKNLCTDSYKAKPVEQLQEDVPASDAMGQAELQFSVRQALETLKQDDRELLLLRFVNQLSVGEISNLSGQSRFAVYRKTNAALAQLKKILKEEDFFE